MVSRSYFHTLSVIYIFSHTNITINTGFIGNSGHFLSTAQSASFPQLGGLKGYEVNATGTAHFPTYTFPYLHISLPANIFLVQYLLNHDQDILLQVC